jgi:hypothetical protein
MSYIPSRDLSGGSRSESMFNVVLPGFLKVLLLLKFLTWNKVSFLAKGYIYIYTYVYIYIHPFARKLYIYIYIYIYIGYTQKNGAVSKVNRKFISYLTRTQRTPSAAAVSHALITILQRVHPGSHDTHPHGT